MGQPLELSGMAWQGTAKGSASLLASLREVWGPDARVKEGSALLCHDASCLRSIRLFGMGTGDSTRLFLTCETCLEMENMVRY